MRKKANHCVDCEKEICRVSTRCRSCEGKARIVEARSTRKWGEDHHAWKGDNARRETKHKRARRRYLLGPCEQCDKQGTERHHKDNDPGNNTKENVMIVCRRCHMIIDGRLAALPARYVKPIEPPKPCLVCHQLSKPLRRGKCHACNEYYRRNHIERVKEQHP